MFGFFQEESGQFSSTRLVMIMWTLALCITWTTICIKAGAFVDIPQNVVIVTGVFMGTKAVQKFTEKKTNGNGSKGGAA
jgi:hypothetical protein